MRPSIWILVVMLTSSSPLSVALVAQEGLAWSGRVQLTVSADEALQHRVESWFTQELRRLAGVVLVDSAAEWVVSTLAFQTRNEADQVMGYALSYVVLERHGARNFLRALALLDTTANGRAAFHRAAQVTTDAWFVRDHRLLVGPTDALRSQIEGLVARLDSDYLEPSRRAFEELLRQPG